MIASSVGLVERMRIEDLYAEYVHVLDEAQYDAWPEFFTEDCTYRVVARENYDRNYPLSTLAFESRAMLRDRVYGITQTLFHEPYYQRHLIANFRYALDDAGGFRVNANYVVIRTKAGSLSEVYSAGRVIDRIVEDDAQLRFAEKAIVFDSELIPNSLIYPL